jgi:uncharacterized membrane protein HdeD (DUF308 family)
VAGILVLVWPGKTILVLAVVLGVWLLVVGVFRLVAAIAFDGVPPDGVPPDGVPPDGVPHDGVHSSRVLLALLGVVAILVGILCLARPFQTATALALLLGAFWVVGGVIEFFHGIVGRVPGRGWAMVGGVLSIIAGIVVLAYPGASLVVLAWLFGIWLIVLGAVAMAAGFAGRRDIRASQQRMSTRVTGPVTP